MAKVAVTADVDGAQSSTTLGSSIGKRKAIVFSFPGPGGKPERFAIQQCNCGNPMIEEIPEGHSVVIPGASPHGKPDSQAGWVIWCDTCDIHAGPHQDRDKTIAEWNELVESLRVMDEL